MSARRDGTVLAIDHGTKHTGFAATDRLRVATRALEVWHGPGDSEALVEHVAALVDERDVVCVLVGQPLNMDGSAGPRSRDVQRFAQRLAARLPEVELVPCDERLSSKEAEELLREAGHGPAERRELRDSWSALVLLRDWLEAGEPHAE